MDELGEKLSSTVGIFLGTAANLALRTETRLERLDQKGEKERERQNFLLFDSETISSDETEQKRS